MVKCVGFFPLETANYENWCQTQLRWRQQQKMKYQYWINNAFVCVEGGERGRGHCFRMSFFFFFFSKQHVLHDSFSVNSLISCYTRMTGSGVYRITRNHCFNNAWVFLFKPTVKSGLKIMLLCFFREGWGGGGGWVEEGWVFGLVKSVKLRKASLFFVANNRRDWKGVTVTGLLCGLQLCRSPSWHLLLSKRLKLVQTNSLH